MSQDKEIQKFLKRLYRWVFWRHLARKLIKCAPAGILGGAVLEIIAYFTPWYSVHFWALGVIGLSLIIAFLWGIVTRPDMRDAALALDQTGLKERTVTAWELIGDDSFFAGLQKKDAWEHLGKVSVRKRLPLGITWKHPVILGAVVAVFLVSFVAPSPAKENAQQRHLVAEQAKEEEEKIEKVSEELAKEDLTTGEYEEYKDLLDQLKQELSEADTQEALDKTLERAEYKLSQVAEETENKSVKEKMQQLSASLGGNQKEDSGDGQDALQAAADMEELSERAEELLEKLEESGDLSELSEEELKELADLLEQLAQAAKDSDLAEALQSAASGISSGNLSSSQLASAQATVGAMKQEAQAVLAQNQSNSGENGNGNNGSGNNSGNGNSNSGNGSGNNSGDGNSNSGNGNGSGNGSGSGSGNGNGNGNGNGSGSGNGSGTGWNYGGKNGTEKETTYNGELVAVPNGVGDDDNLTGSAGEGASYSSQGGPSLTWSGNSVAYDQVIGSYSDQAMSKIQGANYPTGVQDIVKNYFGQLNQ